MPRSKTHSLSEDSNVEAREVRRRVVKACQRCRLKKCKCNGLTPCQRCKSDDAICAYGKHKKTDKIVFRKGYVQMLERQQLQLTAGLQEAYRLISTGQSWPSRPLEITHYGQPLTHKILEGLGVLQSDEWADCGSSGAPDWQCIEQQQITDVTESVLYCDDVLVETAATSPTTATTATFSPTETSQNRTMTFPDSTIMTNRRKVKYDGGPIVPMSQQLTLERTDVTALCTNTHHRSNQNGYQTNSNNSKVSNPSQCDRFSTFVKTEPNYNSINTIPNYQDLPLQNHPHIPSTYDYNNPTDTFAEPTHYPTDYETSPFGNLVWTEDIFDVNEIAHNMPPLQVR